ncbi:MAG: hypothetical protein ABWW69_00865 [Pyrodictiaceae archaeon]
MRITVIVAIVIITVMAAAGLLLSTTSIAQEEEVKWSRIVTVEINGDIYTFGLNISSNYYVKELNKMTVRIELRLIYSTTSEPVFVIAGLKLDKLELASTVLGTVSKEMPSASSYLEAQLPSHIAEKIEGSSQAVFASLEITFIRGANITKTDIRIPMVVSKASPLLTINALFDDGYPYTITFLGETAIRRIIVSITNYGPLNARDVRLQVFLDGKLVALKSVANNLKAGEHVREEVLIPVPPVKGIHTIIVEVYAVVGTSSYKAYTSLTMFTAERPSIYLIPVNKTVFIEGEEACFRAIVINAPVKIANVTLGLEYSVARGERPRGNWSLVLTTPVGTESSKKVLCWTPPSLQLSAKTSLFVRAVLLVNYLGRTSVITSNPIGITVIPLDLAVLRQGLILEVVPSETYVGGKVHVSLLLSPGLPGCYKTYLEKYDPTTRSWVLVTPIMLCNSKGVSDLPSDIIGLGRVWLRARLEIGRMTIISNLVSLTIHEKPLLEVKVPKLLKPGESFNVSAILFPKPPTQFMVSFKPSWLSVPINTTSVNGEARILLNAPPQPGKYYIKVTAIVNDIILEKIRNVEVANITLTMKVSPSRVEAGGEVSIDVIASIPVNDTLVVSLFKGGEVIAARTTRFINGHGLLKIKAPKELGTYIVTAELKELEISASDKLEVIKIKRRAVLSLSNTTVKPRERITARISFEPPIEIPVTINIMVEYPNGIWHTVATSLGAGKEATITFSAPKEPGSYIVQATIPQYNLTSNKVALTVVKSSKQAIPLETFIIIVGGIVMVMAGVSLRALRRRR